MNAEDPSEARQTPVPSPVADERVVPRVAFHPARVDEIRRPEGYRELRCIPAHWMYLDPEPFEALVAEHDSGGVNVDREPDFWSASDAALRVRAVPPERLDLREIMLMATRRAVDHNAPKPWVSRARVNAVAGPWEGRATHVHPFARIPGEAPQDLWNRGGLEALPLEAGRHRIVTGYYMSASGREALSHEPWHGGPGTFYSWATLANWLRWPRRQDVEAQARSAAEGELRLFVSHRWEDLAHPDPSGRQLLALKVGLTLALAAAALGEARRTASGMPELFAQSLGATAGPASIDALRPWAERVRAAACKATAEAELWPVLERLGRDGVGDVLRRIRERVLVWYDYASMHQAPRTPDEEDAFRGDLERLNEIQASTATVVIAGDGRYEARAWCFLEICGGIRHRMVELTPSWGTNLNVYQSANRWAQQSDQLIGALVSHGKVAIDGSGLAATDTRDLPIIAGLLVRLPLSGLIESDGSDLIGGSIPFPFRDGRWFVGDRSERPPDATHRMTPLADYGSIAAAEGEATCDRSANADRLAGDCGVWVYTSQRMLSLAWVGRSAELHESVSRVAETGTLGSVACTWADARALGDDGQGWTRAVPSTVRTLLVVTQADLLGICLLLERVVNAHLDAGTRVITFAPDTGRVTVHEPKPQAAGAPAPAEYEADVLAVPRMRRSTAYPRYMFLPKEAKRRDLEALAAFRLDPSDGAWLRFPDMSGADRLRLSERRVLTEYAARRLAVDWRRLADGRATGIALANPPLAHGQLDVIEGLLEEVGRFSPNPFDCRRLLYVVIEDEDGYLLPASTIESARQIGCMLRERGAVG